MLLSKSGPLSLAPSPHLFRMLPWFAFFLRHCRKGSVQATSLALGSLLARAEAAYDDVWAAASIHVDDKMGRFSQNCAAAGHPFAARHGYLLLQKTQEMMQASQGAAATRRECVPGLQMEALTTDAVLNLEPNLSHESALGGAWYFPDGWFLREPGALLRALGSGFEATGGEIRVGRATALSPRHDSVVVEVNGDGGSTQTPCTAGHYAGGGANTRSACGSGNKYSGALATACVLKLAKSLGTRHNS